MSELLPCPFCGEKGEMTENGDNSPNWLVYCYNWKCQEGYRTEAEAVAAWNQRSRTPLETQLLTACEAALWHVEQCPDCHKAEKLLAAAIAKGKGEERQP